MTAKIDIIFGDTEIFVRLSDGRIASGTRTFHQPNAAKAALRSVDKLRSEGYPIRNRIMYLELKNLASREALSVSMSRT